MGKGEVAAELLGRLEDIDSLRVAALLIRETGRVGGGVVKWTVEKLGWVMVKELHRLLEAGEVEQVLAMVELEQPICGLEEEVVCPDVTMMESGNLKNIQI